MKIHKRKSKPSLTLDSLLIETGELLSILEEVFDADDDLSIRVGNSWDQEYIIIENLQEARAHRSLLKTPLLISSIGIEIDIDKNACGIAFDEDSSAVATSIHERLLEYRHPLKWLDKPWFPAIVGGAPALLLLVVYNISTPLFLGIMIGFSIVFISLWLKISFVNVYFRTRDGFWGRNRDSILVAVILLIIGAGIGFFLERVTLFEREAEADSTMLKNQR